MKTQLQKAASAKARYDADYRRQALEHWKGSGCIAARVVAELELSALLLYRLARLEMFEGTGKESSVVAAASVEQLQA